MVVVILVAYGYESGAYRSYQNEQLINRIDNNSIDSPNYLHANPICSTRSAIAYNTIKKAEELGIDRTLIEKAKKNPSTFEFDKVNSHIAVVKQIQNYCYWKDPYYDNT
jgi:hypothetical protein